MKRRSSPPEEAGSANEWMNTYCDMITLLFAFFVLLFAISQVDVQKFNLVVAALSNRGADPETIMDIAERSTVKNIDEIDLNDPKAPVEQEDSDKKNALQDAYDSIAAAIAASGMSDKVSAYLGDDYIFIRFIDDMLFEPNSARIRQQDMQLLDFIGMSLKSVQDEVGMIRIDGHTASVPNPELYPVSDRDLSVDRANSVLKYLEDRIGIKGEKLSALAFGRFRPIAGNDVEEERMKNRRIEIMVTEADSIATQLDNIYDKIMD